MKLTIGMPHYDDHRGVYMTVQALKLYHDLTDVEVLVVDNSPEKNSGRQCKLLLDHFKGDFNTKYIPMHECRGPAHAKNEVIRQASGDVVLVMDCHVMLGKDAIKRLKEYPIDDSFYTGPLLMDDIRTTCTHFDMMWRGGMWGIWSHAWQHPDGTMFSVHHDSDNFCEFYDMTLSRKKLRLDLPVMKYNENWQAKLLIAGCKMLGTNPDDPPFKIPAQGCGLFVVKKDSWLGFNDAFYGFGAEEGYIHAKYFREGRPTICLPFMRWNHYFRRGDEVPYQVVMQDRIRNYVIGFAELGLDNSPIKAEFVPKHMSEEEWNRLVRNPVGYVRKGAPSSVGHPPESIDSFDKLYEWGKAQNNKEFPTEYLSSLRAYSSRSESVLEVSDNSMNTLALAAGVPKRLHSFKNKSDVICERIERYLKDTEISSTAESVLDRNNLEIYDFILIEPEIPNVKKLLEYLTFLVNKSSRFIGVVGTTAFQFRTADNTQGYAHALKEFCELHPDWFVCGHVPHGKGVTFLSKNPVDRPAEEIRIWPMDNGPGHFLKLNLKKYLGIESTPNCSCNKRALMMDIQGPQWCRDNIQVIVGWLREEYDRRKNAPNSAEKLSGVASLLPFNETAAKILIKTSIKQAEKWQKSQKS